MFNEKNITKLIIANPIIFILITVVISLYISISLLNDYSKSEIENFEKKEIELQKQNIKNQLNSVYTYIEHKKLEAPRRLKEEIKDKVDIAYQLASNIYNKKVFTSLESLEKEIYSTLEGIRFGEDGYYFILKVKSDDEVISKVISSSKKIENKNIIDLKDTNGKFIVKDFLKIVKSQNEGFSEYCWRKITTEKHSQKISYVKYFEPLNLIIGYGEYLDDFEKSIKAEAKERLDLFKFGQNGYVWTHDKNHILLQHPYREDFIGNFEGDLEDKKGVKMVQMFYNKALKNKEGSFVEYYWNKPNETELTKKIAYVKYIEDWDWVIGTGIYVEDINHKVDTLKEKNEQKLLDTVIKSIILFLIILIFVLLLSYYTSRKVNNSFLNYRSRLKKHQNELESLNSSLEEKVQKKTLALQELNEELEEKIAKRVEEIKDKDKALAEQSKMAALGEMIGNIAHQWRQPLSAISTAASGMKIKKEMDSLTDKELYDFSDGIVQNAQYLSQVIEDFKNYIKGEKKKIKFNMNDAVNKSLSIFDSSIHNHNLKVIKSFEDDLFIVNYENEFVQAIVNILNNAKDALKEKQDNEDDRIIEITTKRVDSKVLLIFQDSAKGIDSKIIDKIFEPYFSTKHNDQGTGLGLYMTYQIIVDSMKGSIKVYNNSFEYENKEYKGARFEIVFEV